MNVDLTKVTRAPPIEISDDSYKFELVELVDDHMKMVEETSPME